MTQRYNGSSQRIGDFAEYLVACDLIGQGYRVHMASPGSFYDLILDDNGKLFRVQVKGSMKFKKFNCYKFNLHAKRRHSYFDLVAYVAIDKRLIAYEKASQVNERHISITRFESMTIAKAIADFNASIEISLEPHDIEASER